MNLFENLQKIYESDNLTQKRLSNLTSEEIDKLPDQFLCVCYRGGAGSGHPYTVFDAVSKLADGDDSQFGTTWVADMATGYIGIGYGESDMPQQVPDEVKDSADVIARKIIDGEIVVETTRG